MLGRRFWRDLDYLLLLSAVAIIVYGILILASATRFPLHELTNWSAWITPSRWQFVQRQTVFAVMGLMVVFGCQVFDYRALARWSGVFYIVTVALLVLVLLIGDDDSGSARWLPLGFFQLQPSEFTKLAIIISLASVLSNQADEGVRTWGAVAKTFLYMAPPLVLIIRQPDLGTAIVLLGILAGILVMAGMPLLRFAVLAMGGIAAAIGAVLLKIYFDAPIPLTGYQLKRLIIFLNPAADPFGAGYHIIQSQYAVASGRLFGRGLFQGEQSGLNYLPARHTDFMFSVLGEDLGFIGAAVLILLFLLLLWRVFTVAARAKDMFGALIAAGIGSMYSFHAIVNIGMTIGVMPVTGIPLPFVSYGGSAMLVNLIGIGLVLNINSRRHTLRFSA